jgi:hypothetical protein
MSVQKGPKYTLFRRALVFFAIVGLLLIVTPGAYAKVRTGDGGDVPFYARIERGEIYHTDEWAAIVFYRPPECVPGDFDLLDFDDAPRAFGCAPPTTDGFSIWSGEPYSSAPIQINLHGLGAVPVWFVSWPELQYAIADDGSLTMPELEGMQSLLIGSASFYKETLHPTGGAQVPMINYVAHGSLESGQSFKVHATLVTVGVTHVQIAFN